MLTLSASIVSAQVQSESYTTLARDLDGRISFETLPQHPEPGFNLDAPMRFHGAWLGERLAGQVTSGAPWDVIDGKPRVPLAVVPGKPGQNQSVALHRGFASNALFPIGPGGFPAVGARGEGAVTILFDRDQAAFGLRIQADYADPLGNRPPPGKVQMAFYTRKGMLIAWTERQLGYGITEIGWRRAGNIPDIAAVVITNTDPGGVAIDDIVFQLTALIG
ncbi:MAG: hypothetical protein COC12_04665 [Rhodobacteraceae bacterium]|nr:MAG: hypothetical protein COC12_04665 [Paracoccaceae bacterium]